MAKRIGLKRTQALIENLKRELNMGQAVLKGAARQTITLSGSGATKVLTADDSGSIIFMGGSDASTLTLPAPEEGLNFEVYVTTEHQHIIQTTGLAAVLQGNYRHNSAATTIVRVAITDGKKLTLHSSGRAKGDRLQFWCDGTNYHVDGIVNQALTVTT